ncbi:hypothetical protein [Staphylococcus aureus]|uniref:hypothetical protein n=1 Tax=Staphylococcus aureus TaxID=1280 RepID=UPI0011A0E8A7|nr:hypothetical protein [Staphylococcus aureus]
MMRIGRMIERRWIIFWGVLVRKINIGKIAVIGGGDFRCNTKIGFKGKRGGAILGILKGRGGNGMNIEIRVGRGGTTLFDIC